MKKSYLLALLLCFNLSLYSTEKPNLENYGKNKPFLFMENKGQICDKDGTPRPDILFTAGSNGVKLFFTHEGISYLFTNVKLSEKKGKDSLRGKPDNDKFKDAVFETQHVKMKLIGANVNAPLEKLEKNAYYEN
jgi:hypothetical protein